MRPIRESDATRRYVGWLNDPEINQYLESRFETWTAQKLRRYIRRMMRDRRTVFMGILLKDSRRHIGNVKLDINPVHGLGVIGILLGDKTCWGKGYATEVLNLLSRYAFDKLGLHKLGAGTYASNRGSVRAFLKAGYRVEGRFREQYRDGAKFVDGLYLGKINPRSEV